MKSNFLTVTFLLLSVITFSASSQSEPEHDSSIEVRLINGLNSFPIPNSKSTLRIIVRNGEVAQVMQQTETGSIIKGNVESQSGGRDDCGTCGKYKYIAFTWNDDKGNGGFGCMACKPLKSSSSSSNSEPATSTIYFKNAARQ
jgi:hypothetical protein